MSKRMKTKVSSKLKKGIFQKKFYGVFRWGTYNKKYRVNKLTNIMIQTKREKGKRELPKFEVFMTKFFENIKKKKGVECKNIQLV